ncbi:ATP-dependent DNA ligase [Dactylosporangium matsuzakiense]|uniref:ATP-dependent DNA ligase family profile domain-containing protein n=1 Tax=Dactylosporangium matsuzakiense TaxID=53360 RepID=A0A9W6KSK0_9ACTN|nr:hypothetical protein [Dactylosporangium matsuzakiense]GLL05914.1 hypothetical protein GCM10017581_076620 [Dactylosporangium matsuzakiense]
MLATAGPVPEGPQWRYEFKWDGVRAVVVVDAGQATAFSRNDLDITSGYPHLQESRLMSARWRSAAWYDRNCPRCGKVA